MKIVVLITLFFVSFFISFFSYEPSQPSHPLTLLEVNNSKLQQAKKPLKKTEQTDAAELLDELSLQELALLVDGSFFDFNPWLSAKVSNTLTSFGYLQLRGAYERLSNSKMAGKHQLMNLIVLSMAAQSSIDTLEYLLKIPDDRVTSRHISQVFKNASNQNASDIAEWILSKDYYAVIENKNFAVDEVFAKVAQQSPETAQAYLPRAHIHLKQHIISGLISSFNEYQQYQSLLDYISINEHEVFRKMVMDSMASKCPEQTANWLANNTKQDYSESVYRNIFMAKVQKDFTKAANWYFENATDDKKMAIDTVFFSGRKNYSSQTMLAWAKSLPIEHSNYAIGKLLSWLVGEDNEFVMEHYEEVQDKNQRFTISSKLFNTIRREAPELLDEFIDNSEFSKEWRERHAQYEAGGL
ncbi:MAG: hypothetical protein ACI9UT_003010 [Flavobacteriales bacterium]|jgi:hypothetical protein